LLFALQKLACPARHRKKKNIPNNAEQFSPNKTQVMKSKLLPSTRAWMQRKEVLMSLRTIAARITDKPVIFTDAQEPRALTTLKMIYEGGSLDGMAANFPTRDVSCVIVGRHWGNWHSFETYKRTIWLNIRNRRTIFRCAGHTVESSKSSCWKELLAVLRIRKLKAIVI
jgi:hypothetical protein